MEVNNPLMMTLRDLSSGRANIWKLVLEIVKYFCMMRNVSMSMQEILIWSGLKVLVVTAPRGSWVDITFFAIFLQSDPESIIGGIVGLLVGWGLSEVFLVDLFLSDVVRLVLLVRIGLAGLTGDVDESVVVEEGKEIDSESDSDSKWSGEAWR